MKIKTLIFGLAIFILYTITAYAQGPVTVILKTPPPFQFKIEQFWKVTLINQTGNTIPVYLIGRATERNDGRVVEAISTIFNLPPGLKVVTGRELAPLDVKEYNSKYSDVVKNIGAVPSGDYDICVSVYSATDNSLLGEMCIQSMVENLTQVDLLQPEDGAHFSEQIDIPDNRIVKSIKVMLNEIPEGYDSKTALWALLRALYPEPEVNSKIKEEGDDPGGIEISELKGSSKIKEEGDDIEWLPGIIVHDTDDCSGQGIQYFKAVMNLRDPDIFLKTLRKVEDPGTLLDILERECKSNHEGGNFTGTTNAGRIASDIYPSTNNGETSTKSDIQPLPGGVMILSWLPPAPLPYGAKVSYTLHIAQIMGRQSPYDAIHSNPNIIKMEKIPTNMVQLPLAARRLLPGSYAWAVDVYLNNVLVQNSDVWHFFIDENLDAKSEKPRRTQTGLGRGVYSLNDYPQDNSWCGGIVPQMTLRPNITTLFTNPNFFQGIPSQQNNQGVSVTPFAIIGTASIDAQYSDRVGSYSETPRNQLTADLRPGIKLYGLPFSGNFLFSTLQDANKQSMNSFGINFDFEGMRQGLESRLQESIAKSGDFSSMNTDQLTSIASPSLLTSNLEKYGGITGAEKLFMSIRSLGIGTNYPSYSDYVLNGVPVTGINLELNPGIFYSAFTASKNQGPIDNSAYLRNLYSGRLGIGKKENTHLYFTGLYVSDDASSIRLDTSNTSLTPRENYVFGMEGKLTLFNKHIALEGEGAVSLLTRDTRDPEFASSAIPSFVTNLITPRLSSSVDYMYSGRIVYENMESATKISAGLKMIGPGYASLGVPNLRTDQFGYEAKFDQKFFKRHVTLGSFFRTYSDNLIDWKSSTTTMTTYGVNLGLNFPRLPYLRVSFSPITQKNNATDTLYKFETNIMMISAMTGYSYRLGSIYASTYLAYTGQQTEMGNASGDYKSKSYMIGEMFSFSFLLTLGLNLGFIESETALGYGVIQTVDLNCQGTLSEIFQIGGGVTFATERNNNERIGFYANSTIQITRKLYLDLRLEHNTYNDFILLSSKYNEFLFRCNLGMNF